MFESRTTVPTDANNPDYAYRLQFIGHEEGRIRFVQGVSPNPSRYVYDYFVKDHLGNVRMVLTEANKTDAYPMASMEVADSAIQNLFYTNLATTRWPINLTPGYPTDGTTVPNDNVAKVNGSGNRIGPAIILKVMAGDKFNYRVTSWYKKNGTSPGTPVSPLTDLIRL